MLKVFVVVLLCLVLPTASFAGDRGYLDSLLEKARREKVHEERTWQVLLHYTGRLSGGYQSRIDDPRFFASPAGRTDPQAELAATLQSFFGVNAKDGEHGLCRFPARFEWLSSRLGIDPSRLPGHSCSQRDKSLGSVEPKSAVLVFPVGHINSPASMFGHTLIRIDGSSRSNLISYAVNYAATAVDSNGFIYAWKGLTGMYKGYYSIMPYYTKVKEYNDLEHRDMWEYRLRLSEEEVRKMLNHIWELQEIASSYYFLDENCSYNLLFLIEAARPELRLTEKTGLLVLPTNTIRIAMQSGILDPPVYRPSQGTRIKKIMSLLDGRQLQVAYQRAYQAQASERPGGAPLDQMKELDLAVELVQYRYGRKDLGQDAYNQLYLKLLSERSSLGAAPEGIYDVSEPPRPETGHDTTKVALGGGARRGEPFVQLEVQPEFHTLLDPDQGYLPGAQMKFLDTALRYNLRSGDFQLKTFHLLDILSIAPRDYFFKPLSWKVNVGLDSEPLRNGNDYLLFRLNTGGGFAYSSPFDGICYAMGEVDFNAAKKIRADATIGPGFTVGWMEQVTKWWKLHLSARGFVYKLGDDRATFRLAAAQNFRLSRDNGLTAEYSSEWVNGHRVQEAGIFWSYFF